MKHLAQEKFSHASTFAMPAVGGAASTTRRGCEDWLGDVVVSVPQCRGRMLEKRKAGLSPQNGG